MQANATSELPATTDMGNGQLVYNIQTKELLINDAGTLKPVFQIGSSYATVEGKDSSVTTGSTTASSYTNTLTTTGIRGVSFVAPPSGLVLIHGMATGWNNNNNPSLLSVETRTGGTIGSGSVVLASDDNTASENHAGVNIPLRHKVMSRVSGLTAGTTYNAALTYRGIGGSTCFYNRRHVIVQPMQF